MPKSPLISAGLLLFRRKPELEVFLAFPGGPYFTKKDKGWWMIPKGLVEEGESYEAAALREFEEETGFYPKGDLIELGQIKQKAGKVVHAWAVEGDVPENWILKSNTFRAEWPPRSGKWQIYPETAKARFFTFPEAQHYILPSQQPLLERLFSKVFM